MQLIFRGAAKTVTGSCYQIQDEGVNILVDCGMFQGSDVEDLNSKPFAFDPKSIDFVLLTHAHMDHCGLLPKLVRQGFTGKIYLTPPTSALAELVLLDSAKIQEIESRKNSNNKHIYSESMPFEMHNVLYDTIDAQNTISRFVTKNLGDGFMPMSNVSVRFVPAGHILGAASIEIVINNTKLLFSGDLGRIDQSIVNPFSNSSDFDPDYIIMESLYGGITHQDRESTTNMFLNSVNNTIERDGNVIIPSFAIHRTQEILELLKISITSSCIKGNVQIILDSPMASRATRIYTQFASYFNRNFSYGEYSNVNGVKKSLVIGDYGSSRFDFDELRYIRTAKQSLRLKASSRSIIIAGSGMVEGGRILQHVASYAPKSRNSLLFVGYQAEGTLGRAIVDGAKVVKINKRDIDINSQVEYIRGFSAHADEPTLLFWLNVQAKSSLKQIFLVHAEESQSKMLQNSIVAEGRNAIIPDLNESHTL